METLENKTEVCINQLKVNRNIVYTEQEYKCKICENPTKHDCYKPYKPNTELRRY